MVATTAGCKSGLLSLCNVITKWQFLVDTRAEVSVLPATGLDRRTRQAGPQLLAANGSSIKTYGMLTFPLHFASKTFWWDFVVADVARPLLGADFLSSNSLLVDLEANHWWMQQPFALFHLDHPESPRPILASHPASPTSTTYCSESFRKSQLPTSFGLTQSMA